MITANTSEAALEGLRILFCYEPEQIDLLRFRFNNLFTHASHSVHQVAIDFLLACHFRPFTHHLWHTSSR